MGVWDAYDAGLKRGERIGGEIRYGNAYRDGGGGDAGLANVSNSAGLIGDLETANYADQMGRSRAQEARTQRRFNTEEERGAYQWFDQNAGVARSILNRAHQLPPDQVGAFLNQPHIRGRLESMGFQGPQIDAAIQGLSGPEADRWFEDLDAAFRQHEDPQWSVSNVTGRLQAIDPNSSEGRVLTGEEVPGAQQIRDRYQAETEAERRRGLPTNAGAYRVLSPEEVTAQGLPPGSYQINDATGQITPIGRQRGQYTEFAGTSANYAASLDNANNVITQNSPDVDWGEVWAVHNSNGLLPLGGGSTLARSTLQAMREFLNAINRRESGAAINADEWRSARQLYFPVPGDPPEVIEQKARSRALKIESMAAMSQGAAEEFFPDRFNGRRQAGAGLQSPSDASGIEGLSDAELEAIANGEQ